MIETSDVVQTTINVLSEVIRSAGRDKQVRLIKYKNAFDELWREGSGLLNWIGEKDDGTKDIVIFWDGQPGIDEPPIIIADHLTPLDWAFSLSRHWLAKGSPTLPALRVFIIPLLPSDNAFAWRMRDSILPVLSWVRIYKPGAIDDLKKDLQTQCPDFGDLAQSNNAKVAHKVETLAHAWIGNLSGTGSHHDVNNLLGPLVLCGDSIMADGQALQGRHALLQHARWLGLAPALSASTAGNGDSWYASNTLCEAAQTDVGLLLVDDCANKGWADVLTKALGLERKRGPDGSPYEAPSDRFGEVATGKQLSLRASTSIDVLLMALATFIKDGALDLRFRLRLGGVSGETQHAEVLFLDLRLSNDRTQELAYFKSTLELARQLAARPGFQWPWVPLSPDLIGANGSEGQLGEWLANAVAPPSGAKDWRRTEGYLGFLTLLPRLLASLDPSYPIVIFSSTGQSQVTELLKDYGNIITVFNKPRFTAYVAESILPATRQRFGEALDGVVQLLKAQAAMRRIRVFALKAPKPADAAAVPEKPYVEVFIDESGSDVDDGGNRADPDSPFVVAGMALVYKSERDAIDLQSILNAGEQVRVEIDEEKLKKDERLAWRQWIDSVDPGVHEWNDDPEASYEYPVCMRWCGKPRLPKRLSSPTNPRWADIKREAYLRNTFLFPVLKKMFDGMGVLVFPFVLWTTVGRVEAINVLHNKHVDNLYLNLSKKAIDALLFEMLPWYLGGRKYQCRIFAATRARGGRFDEEAKKALFRDFGILVESGEVSTYYRSIGADTFAPIVADILFGRPHTRADLVDILGASGNQLKEGDKCPDRLRYILHHAWLMGREAGKSELFEIYKNKYFSYTCDESGFRHCHYVADLIANASFAAIKNPNCEVVSNYFPNRLWDKEDDVNFLYAVDASKCMEANDLPGALLRAAAATYAGGAAAGAQGVASIVCAKLARKYGDLTGQDFMVFARALQDWLVSPKGGTLPKRHQPPTDRRARQQGTLRQTPQKTAQLHNLPGQGNRGDKIILSGFDERIDKGSIVIKVKEFLAAKGINPSRMLMEAGKSVTGRLTCKIMNANHDIYGNIRSLEGALWKNCNYDGSVGGVG